VFPLLIPILAGIAAAAIAAEPATCNASLEAVTSDNTAVIKGVCSRPVTIINLLRNQVSMTFGVPLNPPAAEVHFVSFTIPGVNVFSITGENRTVIEGSRAILIIPKE
jgi:hypothetical protein